MFWPYAVWRNKEWYRLLTGGFVHLDFAHLLFNMFVLFSFGTYIEQAFAQIFGDAGVIIYGIMYVLAIILADTINLAKSQD